MKDDRPVDETAVFGARIDARAHLAADRAAFRRLLSDLDPGDSVAVLRWPG